MKQLVDGALELEKKNIFHRDIKVENVLIETGSDAPRVWLIDFGLSCFAQEGSLFKVFRGTMSCFSLLLVYQFSSLLSFMTSHYCVLQAQQLTFLQSGAAVAATVLVLPRCGSWECSFMRASTVSLTPQSSSATIWRSARASQSVSHTDKTVSTDLLYFTLLNDC